MSNDTFKINGQEMAGEYYYKHICIGTVRIHNTSVG